MNNPDPALVKALEEIIDQVRIVGQVNEDQALSSIDYIATTALAQAGAVQPVTFRDTDPEAEWIKSSTEGE